jgi:regulation of enolase protein 1 (concanavalin A-like superfamily)
MPQALSWHATPQTWALDDAHLRITAGPRTDLFTDPRSKVAIANSPRLAFDASGDCLLSTRVSVAFAATYDAGVLVAYADAQHWAKLCFEFSPQRQPMIVSVVTRGDSDDCNSVVIEGNMTWLRLAKLDNACAFHYSLDGAYWRFVRYFNLGMARTSIGFSAQSPTGDGCEAIFEHIRFEARALSDLRSGE